VREISERGERCRVPPENKRWAEETNGEDSAEARAGSREYTLTILDGGLHDERNSAEWSQVAD
jgi:hypothetical protein